MDSSEPYTRAAPGGGRLRHGPLQLPQGPGDSLRCSGDRVFSPTLDFQFDVTWSFFQQFILELKLLNRSTLTDNLLVAYCFFPGAMIRGIT